MTKPGRHCTARPKTRLTRFETLSAHELARFAAQRPLRAGSLIVTVFGDVVAARGGEVWLGSLIRLLEPFGLSERLVRTAVHRLVAEGWLESEKIGRHSYYRFSHTGASRFGIAARKIYGPPQTDWDGKWSLVQFLRGPANRRERLKREFRWLGYTQIAPGLMASPRRDCDALAALRQGVDGSLMIDWVATTGGETMPQALRELLEQGLRLAEVGTRYTAFIERFSPLHAALARLRKPDPRTSLLARIQLVHEYRRAVLRDPRLPRELWPAHWPAQRAYDLGAAIYRRLVPASEDWIDRNLQAIDGEMPPAGAGLATRFGGSEA